MLVQFCTWPYLMPKMISNLFVLDRSFLTKLCIGSKAPFCEDRRLFSVPCLLIYLWVPQKKMLQSYISACKSNSTMLSDVDILLKIVGFINHPPWLLLWIAVLFSSLVSSFKNLDLYSLLKFAVLCWEWRVIMSDVSTLSWHGTWRAIQHCILCSSDMYDCASLW
jgi:hypothetical protein